MPLPRRTLTTTAVAAVSAAMVVGPALTSPASADSTGSEARKLDSSVIAPFQIAVRGTTAWWTDGFGGTITRYKNGQAKVIARVPAEGLAVRGKKIAYTASPQ